MATEENAEPRSARYLTYSLLAGQHLLTLVTRIALPYIVAFISQEQQLSEQQRATLLSSFTAGYVWMQIPGGYLAERIGNKAICLINNVSVAALLLGFPTIARGGVRTLSPALALVGMLQGPLMISVGSISTFWLPPPSSAERPWAQLAVRTGSHLSKIVGPSLTPILAARFGWRAACRIYALCFVGYAVLWQSLARERPRVAARGPASPGAEPSPAAAKKTRAPFTLRLLTVKSQVAVLWSQVCHDLLEFQTLVRSFAPCVGSTLTMRILLSTGLVQPGVLQ